MNSLQASAKYRPEVDGLRAMAILSVILYHMDFRLFKGGFVGVDVFFVISGFLITSIIEQSIQTQTFSLKEFYLKRARRILPSFVTVIVAIMLFGFFALLSQEYVLLGKSVSSAVLFWSNVWLNSHVGYFDKASDLKPLLHFWSLAVEEQFYFIWPLILIWLPKKNRIKFILLLCLLSFIYAFYNSYAHPSKAFYLIWSRFWQIGAGGLLSQLLSKKKFSGFKDTLKSNANIISALGFAFILLSVFLFDKEQSFPSWRALFPTLGAMLIIATGNDSQINRTVLANKWMLAIGIISYPLYLWHWPLLYLNRVMSYLHPSTNSKIITIAMSFFLAYISTHIIEKKFRSTPTNSPKLLKLIAIHFSLIILSLAASKWGNLNKASDSLRVNEDYKTKITKNCILPAKFQKELTWCETDKRNSANHLIIGDSHAGALYPSLVNSSGAGESWQIMARAGCAPQVSGCSDIFFKASEELKTHPEIKEILIVFSSRMLDENSARLIPNEKDKNHAPRADVIKNMLNFIDSLSLENRKLKILLSAPAITSEPEFCLPRPMPLIAQENSGLTCKLPKDSALEIMKSYRDLVFELKSKKTNLIVIDPLPNLCDQNICGVLLNGKSLYSYSDHLSDFGNSRILDLIRNSKN